VRDTACSEATLEPMQSLIEHPALAFGADPEIEVARPPVLAFFDSVLHHPGLRTHGVTFGGAGSILDMDDLGRVEQDNTGHYLILHLTDYTFDLLRKHLL
jgi:hypothetical protein